MNDFCMEVRGSGPAVLLLHGVPSPIAAFEPVLRALEGQSRLLLPERPGYGRSSPAREGYSPGRFTTALEDRLVALGVREAAIVSFSGGSLLGLSLAARRYVSVTRMVLLGGFAFQEPGNARALREVAAGIRARAVDLASPDFRKALAESAVAPASRSNAALLAEVGAWFDAVRDPDMFASELEWCASEDLRPVLPSITAGLTLLTGDHDTTAPPSAARAIASFCPNARVEILPGAGHCLLAEVADIGVHVKSALTAP